MNTSSKYANLPFIAAGEKDVYETEDLPEADQLPQQPIHDASIEIIPSSSIDAYQKFAIADSSTDASESDKSNKLSLTERFKKLQLEIEDLKDAARDSQKSDTDPILNDVDNLYVNLENLHDVCFKKVNNLQMVKDVLNEEVNKNLKEPLIYELYQKPEKEEILKSARVNALEQRLKKIETTLGLNDSAKDSNYPLLNNYLKNRSVMNIVIDLSNKILQMDNSSLDRIDARLHLIIEKLNQISDKKSSITELDKEDKLNEIYNCYVKYDQNRSLIPNLLERVQVFNDMQDQASKFSNTLAAMEAVQNEIKSSLESNQQSLKNLEKAFEKAENIEKLINDFQQRLNKLTSQ